MNGFIRIQKTASSSIFYSLKGRDIKLLYHGFCYSPDKIIGWKWRGVNKQIFKVEDYETLYATVRNPFDLLLSYYTHSKDGDGWGDCNNIHSIHSWEDFLHKYTDPEFEWHIPEMKKSLFSFLYDEDGNVVANKVFKYENLNEIEEYFNIKLPEINFTSKKLASYKEVYSPYYVDTLSRIWKRDLEQFNYRF